MDIHSVISILETLANGCSPETGEILKADSVLHQRDVIRALQFAIDTLRKDAGKALPVYRSSDIDIDESDILTAMALFHDQNYPPTKSRLTSFFLANRAFRNEAFTSHPLYGKHKKNYTKGQLLGFFTDYLSFRIQLPDHPPSFTEGEPVPRKPVPNEAIDNAASNQAATSNKKNAVRSAARYFHKPHFNGLSHEDLEQLKERIQELGVTKVDDLSEQVVAARKEFPRAYEPWSDTEKQLLDEALHHTNDPALLSHCFQRNEGAILSCGAKIIADRRTT